MNRNAKVRSAVAMASVFVAAATGGACYGAPATSTHTTYQPPSQAYGTRPGTQAPAQQPVVPDRLGGGEGGGGGGGGGH